MWEIETKERERENDCTDICFAALKKNKRKRERERGKEREREIKGGRKVYLRRKRLCVCDRESEGGIEWRNQSGW